MTFTSYDVKVSGIAWAGYKASTEYNFDHQPTKAEVLAKAGDFQSVARIQVTERKITLNTRVGLAKERIRIPKKVTQEYLNTLTDEQVLGLYQVVKRS